MAANLNIVEAAKEIQNRLPSQEHTLGKGLMQPFNNTNSGSRKIMQGIQREHVMQLMNSEVPIIGTGFETEFGKHSSSYIEADHNFVVIDKISKFSQLPNYHYYAILLDSETNTLDVIERVGYKHITEAYGYMYNNEFLDSAQVDDTICTGDVIKKSASFDEFNNKRDGVNLTTIYVSSDKTMEDSIIISESAARKFTAPLFNKVPLIINDNDILLNLYGDENSYKTFPDIGEEVNNGILCGVRREKKDEEALFTQSYNKLRDIMMSDDKYTVKGKVIDINVYCNNPEKLTGSYYNSQVKKYYDDNVAFCKNIVECVGPLIKTGLHMTYDLQKLYYNCENVLTGKQYIKEEKVFSNIIMEVIVMEELPLIPGDKVTDRYGGKGVISNIVPDRLMPRLPNGEYVDIQFNKATCVNRVNPGQLFETSITHISNRILDYLATQVLETNEALGMVYDYMSILNKEQADSMFEYLQFCEEEEQMGFIESILLDGGIFMSLRPISDSLTIDKLAELYEMFPWVKQCTLTVPIKDSNGNYRFIPSRRPIVAGKKYIYRVKQFAEEKFSVTSLSATNIRNENSKSKSSKVYKSTYTKTPIKFGEMETGDMAHLGMEAVIVMLMIYSASPQARRLAEQLLTGDPFDVDVKLDSDSTNRGVEILNAYLKTMGLRLTFQKVYKNIKQPILKTVIRKLKPTDKDLITVLHKSKPGDIYDPDAAYQLYLDLGWNPKLRNPILKRVIKKTRG